MIGLLLQPIFREWITVPNAITTVQRTLFAKSLRDRDWSLWKMGRGGYPRRFDRGETNAEEMDKVIIGCPFSGGPSPDVQFSGLRQ